MGRRGDEKSSRHFHFRELAKRMTDKKREESDLGSDDALYAAREKVIKAMPLIIDAIIKKATDGSYQHAKFLLEFAESEGGVRPSLA